MHSFAALKAEWKQKTAAVNNNVPIPLEVQGIAELPRVTIKVLTNPQGQIAVGGFTLLVKQFTDISKLNSNGTNDTFSYVRDIKKYVCEKNWSAEAIQKMLQDVCAEKMQHIAVDVIISKVP